jgi:hypothetical protein
LCSAASQANRPERRYGAQKPAPADGSLAVHLLPPFREIIVVFYRARSYPVGWRYVNLIGFSGIGIGSISGGGNMEREREIVTPIVFLAEECKKRGVSRRNSETGSRRSRYYYKIKD